ncbi:hypothetical protein [Pandoraea communis]|uniref:hypothetical protein n=1 Tax=Pandoraea communis TaxID=2508297 RepID=UPI0025A6174B|nr:hypothetical protein [Pandoraea communis]MDM8356190.1 hypothetical protein [Pandoraea communis]
MAEKNINWLGEVVSAKNKADSEKRISHLDDHLVQILAIKRLGFNWDKTAEQTNRILGLKGLEKVSGAKLARICAKWKAAGLIDLKKVDAFYEQVTKSLSSQAVEQPKTAPAIQPVTPPPANPAPSFPSLQSGAFADAKEFARAIVERFPGLKHDTELVQKSFEANKGKDKETMLKAYRDALSA